MLHVMNYFVVKTVSPVFRHIPSSFVPYRQLSMLPLEDSLHFLFQRPTALVAWAGMLLTLQSSPKQILTPE